MMGHHWADNITTEMLFPDEETKERMKAYGCENWLQDIHGIYDAYYKWKRRAIIKTVLLYVIIISLYVYVCYLVLC